MSSSTISILGLYQFGNYQNEDLFKNMILPDGIDRETLIDTILEQCAEFEAVYPNFEYLQFSIGTWSKRWKRTFTKWVDALNLKYDPLNNYDRTEEWSETDTGKATSTDKGNSQNDNYVTAYNSDNLRQQSRTLAETAGTQTAESTNENVKKGRAYGNIGVTTSQQMLEAELEIDRFNLIQQITDIFKQEFCILVY